MLDYAMLWVQSLEAYTTLTNDPTLAAEIYPDLQAFLAYLERNTEGNGLLNVRRAPWGLSTYLDTIALFSRWGQSSAINSMYYGTLLSAANIANELSDSASAENWLSKAERVKNQINANLYIPGEGRYVATILSGRVYTPDPYAQAWPLAYGVVPESDIPRVTASLLEILSKNPELPNVNVYGMNWVLEGLGRSGHISEALEIIRLYFGYILDSGATTWWESFTAPKYYWSAYSHGWGSSPTWFLTTYVLGGRWTGPDTWEVRPALEGVDKVSGILPVGDQIIHISWEIKSCSQAEIVITAPVQTSGDLIIPYADVSLITLDGATLVKNGVSLVGNAEVFDDNIQISLAERGQYYVIIERACP
jgi:alpha-L-rhamnosidase